MVVEAMAEAVIEVEKAAKVAVAKAGAVRARATVLMVKAVAVVAKTGSARARVARVMEVVATVVGSLAPLKPASPSSVTVHLWSR